MKKFILSLILGLFLVSFAVAECTDSDGLDYFSAGEVGYPAEGLTVSDFCLSDITSNLDSGSPIIRTMVDNMIASGVITEAMVQNEDILLEARCPSSMPEVVDDPFIFQTAYECPNGCSEGACVEADDNPRNKASCANEGEKFSQVYEEYPDNCCAGLTKWHSGMDTREIVDGECIATGMVSGNPIGTCINCGNGICEDIENICNCPADCNGDDNGRQGLGQTIRNRVKAGVYTNANGDQIQVKELAQNRMRLQVGNGSVDCDCNKLNLTQEQVQNRTKLKAMLSNGRNAEVKIMPNVASATALARLRLKNCDGSRNCSIELKEVGNGEKVRLVYEAKARKTFKIWGFIKNREQVQTQIDAETGEVVATKRPWWAWMASEPEEADEN